VYFPSYSPFLSRNLPLIKTSLSLIATTIRSIDPSNDANSTAAEKYPKLLKNEYKIQLRKDNALNLEHNLKHTSPKTRVKKIILILA
jgi:hypothetical protein